MRERSVADGRTGKAKACPNRQTTKHGRTGYDKAFWRISREAAIVRELENGLDWTDGFLGPSAARHGLPMALMSCGKRWRWEVSRCMPGKIRTSGGPPPTREATAAHMAGDPKVRHGAACLRPCAGSRTRDDARQSAQVPQSRRGKTGTRVWTAARVAAARKCRATIRGNH